MEDSDPSSSPPASTYLVERLFGEEKLSDEAYDRARELVWPAGEILRWIDRGLLGAGAALVASGALYWLISRWWALPRIAKFGVVETVLVASLAVAWFRGLDDWLGLAGLSTATVSLGAFLVVFGLAYPTGADTWTLFASWAALTAGFAAVSNFQPVWVLWVGMIDTAAALYWLEAVPEASNTGFTLVTGAMGLFTLVVLTAGEVVRARRAPDWLDPPWGRWVLLAAGLALLSMPVWTYVGVGRDPATWLPFATLGLWATALIASYLYYRRRSFDLVALTIVGLVAASTPTIRLFTAFMEQFSLELALLVVGIAVLVGSSLLVYWLRGLESAREGA